MTNASTRRTTAINAFTGLTYVESTIGSAASNGLFSVMIEGNYIDDTVTGSIQSAGYGVTKKFHDMGTYPRYLITW